MKINIILALSGIIFAYLLASFVNWDLNPGNWETVGRIFTAFIAISLSGGAIGVNESIKSTLK